LRRKQRQRNRWEGRSGKRYKVSTADLADSSELEWMIPDASSLEYHPHGVIDVYLVNDRHPNRIGLISGFPLVGFGSLSVQTSIKRREFRCEEHNKRHTMCACEDTSPGCNSTDAPTQVERKAVSDAPIPVLIAAYGNELAGDDSFGLLAAEAVRAMAISGAEVVSLGMKPASLLNHLAGRIAVCVVDAARCDGMPVGTLIDMDFFDADLPSLVHDGSLSTHGLSVADELELARQLDLCPQIVRLVAVAAGSVEVGRSACDEVLRQVPVAGERIADWVMSVMRFSCLP
jgi:hydrogenase maturation protease